MKNAKIAEALKQIGLGFTNLGEALALESEPNTEAPTEPKGTRKKKVEAAAPAAPASSTETPTSEALAPVPEAKPGVPELTIEIVRQTLMDFSNPEKTFGGSIEKAKALLSQYGVGKLGDLKPEQFPAFMKSIADATPKADDAASLL